MLTTIRRTTAYLLALALVLSLLPAQSAWAEEIQPDSQETTVFTEPAIAEETLPETVPTGTEIPEELLPEEQPLSPEENPDTETQPEEMEPAETEPQEAMPEAPEAEPTLPSESEPVPTEPSEILEQEEFTYAGEIPDDFSAPFSRVGSGVSFFSTRLPSSYDSRDAGVITPVKDQNSWQLCWAFSALAVGESYLISSGENAADLSERHLGHYFHGRAEDPLGNADGDSTYFTDNYLLSGNNNKFTTFALANWVGAALEEKYPYEEDPSLQEGASAMDDEVHLVNAYWINAQDRDSIKYYVMRNGSVGISIYFLNSFYNSKTAAYYNNAYTATNHAITIVGWDDNYSPDNFDASPGEQGAWLCKNSHGTDFGQEGFFWLSYQDKSISHASATAFVFEFEHASNYDWNYHHDGSCGTTAKTIPNGGSIANIYTASGCSDGYDEELRAVGFAPADADLEYSIQIYRDLEDPADPTSGTPALSQPQVGHTGLCGYYSIPLHEPVALRQGEPFSVVVTLHSELSNIRYFVDYTYQNGTWIQFTSATGPNRSFAAPPDGEWTDLVEAEAVARIKAYTVSTNSRSIAQLDFETEYLVLTQGDTFFQEPGKLPEDADSCLYRWHSDREEVAWVSEDGIVTAADLGEAVITASTPDGRVYASYRVSVKPKIDSLGLRRYKSNMTTGEQFETAVDIFPNTAAPYYTVTLNSSDESVVSVSGMTLQAHAPGTTTITLWAEPYYREYSVTVRQSLKEAQVTVGPVIYTGSPLKPSVSIVLEDNLLTENQDYNLIYSNNTLPGTATVTVNGMGRYCGTLQQNFSIGLPETQIRSLENTSGGIRITWEPSSGLTGYYLYRQKNNGTWKMIKTVNGKSSWLDEEPSTSGARFTYKVVPYLKAGKKIYKSEESPEVALHRLLSPKIKAIQLADVGMEISWSSVSGADSYRILRSTQNAPEELVATVAAGSTLRWADASAAETGLQYNYRVIAQCSEGELVSLSAASNVRSACRPVAPAGFTAANTAKGITLSWGQVENAAGYVIYRSTNGIKWTTAKTISGGDITTWTDTTRSSGSKSYYRICTWMKCSGTTYRSEPADTPVIYRLSRPAVDKIRAAEEGFTLSWKRIAGADGYQIYRSCDGSPAELLATIENGRTLTFTDQTASETGRLYAYSLCAWKKAEAQTHHSENSPEKSAVHPESATTFSAVNTARGITLFWEKVNHATGYVIYRSTNGTKWTTVKTVSGGETLSWTDTARSSGAEYYYRIQTLAKRDGTTFRSDFSGTQKIYRLSSSTVTKIISVEGGFTLTWKRIAGADGYRIYRSCDGGPRELLASIDSGKILTYTDQSASATGRVYTYSLCAWKEAEALVHLSAISPEKSAIHPEIPAAFAASATAKGITLSWERAEHATGYEIQRSTNGIKWTTVKTVSGGSSLSWRDTTRSSGSNCRYRIRTMTKLNGVTFRSDFSNVAKP